MTQQVELVDIHAGNVEKAGFFCLKSRPKAPGYARKLAWLQERFAEGLRLKILREGKRLVGFIEYIPGEHTWRAVEAEGYIVIHCLWVVGQAKGQGYGNRLLETCLEDARRLDRSGVVMVAGEDPWLAGRQFFLQNGFEWLEQAPPAFDLLALRLKPAFTPSFPKDWESRLQAGGEGLTVQTSGQCPYLDTVEMSFEEAARLRGIAYRRVEFQSSREARRQAFSPYGVFGAALNGRLLTYHWEAASQLSRIFDAVAG